MIYYHNKLKKGENVSLKQFIKVVEFLESEGVVSKTFYEHHKIYEYYKNQLTFCDEYDARISTLTEFNIGKVTFYNIKRKFKNS